MKEQEWLSGTNPKRMLDFVRDLVTDRKLRLFAVACCRHIWHVLVDRRSRIAMETSERYADDRATEAELLSSLNKAIEAERAALPRSKGAEAACFERKVSEFGIAVGVNVAADLAAFAVTAVDVRDGIGPVHDMVGVETERVVQGQYVRDIFGNPHRRVIFNPRWRTIDVLGVAHAIYEERAFERMPILADALMDAGCGDELVIEHCRGNGPHVRGCWVVDLVLGKT